PERLLRRQPASRRQRIRRHQPRRPQLLPVESAPVSDRARADRWRPQRAARLPMGRQAQPFRADPLSSRYEVDPLHLQQRVRVAFYSGVDQELTYTFDREGFRFTTNAPFNPSNPAVVCQSAPVGGIAAAPDPNPWLIDTDEMAFMARDAGAQAPPGATLPRGIADAREVVITDPITLEQS